METLGNEKNEKNEKFSCVKCDFICRFKSDWKRHIITPKHIRQSQQEIFGNNCQQDSANFTSPNILSCEKCSKKFQSISGLWKHKKKCSNTKDIASIEEKAKSITDKDEVPEVFLLRVPTFFDLLCLVFIIYIKRILFFFNHFVNNSCI